MKIEKILYPRHPVRCIITGPSCSGKSVFLLILISNIIIEFDRIYIYSPSLHQDLYQKLIEYFSSFLPINIIPKIVDEGDIDVVIDEICSDKTFRKQISKYTLLIVLKN